MVTEEISSAGVGPGAGWGVPGAGAGAWGRVARVPHCQAISPVSHPLGRPAERGGWPGALCGPDGMGHSLHHAALHRLEVMHCTQSEAWSTQWQLLHEELSAW